MQTRESRASFVSELARFLPARLLATARDAVFWDYIVVALRETGTVFMRSLEGGVDAARWEL